MSSFSSHEAPYKFNCIQRDDNIDLSRPLTTPDMMVLNEYPVITLIENDKKVYDNITTLRLNPLELGASIYFFSKKEEKGFIVPIKFINDVRLISATVGRIIKKQDLMLFISYFKNKTDLKNDTNNVSLIIDVYDFHINYILKELKSIHQNLQDNVLWTSERIITSGLNNDSSINIYPNLPFLFKGEEILWTNKDTQGFMNKKITFLDLITNYRILHYDYFGHKGTSILMDEIETALINNQRNIPKASIIGAAFKSRIMRGGSGQVRKEEGDSTYGDVEVSSFNKTIITIENVDNPSQIANTIMNYRKKLYTGSENQYQKKNQHESNKTTHNFQSNSSLNDNDNESNEEVCAKCQSKNLAGSIFCNYCGNKIEQTYNCKKCNNVNMKGAIFCNQCGNRL